MHNFGFKVVDKDPELLGPVIDYAIRHGRPVEVGLYFGDPQALELLEQKLFNAPIAVNAHTDYDRLTVFNLHHNLDLLEDHLRLAKTLLGSAYSVLHIASLPMTLRSARRPDLMKLLLDNLERAEELCVTHDYRLHLENVFHPVPFYRELFDGIHARDLSHSHFCFDVGHAKVWSGESLDEWLQFIEELAAMGFGLHCHLHANQGFTDEHLSMAEVEALGICGPDAYYNAYGYPAAFWAIQDRFPTAVKVFEVGTERAIANLEAVVAARALPNAALAAATPEKSAAARRKRLNVKRQQVA
jgi:hypothetical protein